MYTIKKRNITLNDFVKLKKHKPIKKFRQEAKSINFGAIFGAIGKTLAASMKNSGYSLEDVEEAIKMFGLEPILKDAISLGKAAKMGEKALKYAIVGDKFRELFFKTYPGLLERIESGW